MKELEQKILSDGYALNSEVLKVDSFINHQIDPMFMKKVGLEFKRLFEDKKINKVLTIEASGIAIGMTVAMSFEVPLVFAKKSLSRNLDSDKYVAKVYSFTKDKTYDVFVSKKYLNSEDNVLIIDDFLANGQAVEGLIDIVEQAGAKVKGVGIVVEKGFQPGGAKLRKEGVDVKSLAIIKEMDKNYIKFEEQ